MKSNTNSIALFYELVFVAEFSISLAHSNVYAFIDTYPISTSTKTTALNVTIHVNDSMILSLWKRFNSAACVYIPFKATIMMPDKTHWMLSNSENRKNDKTFCYCLNFIFQKKSFLFDLPVYLP